MFAQKIRNLRVAHGLSQTALADQLGVSQQTVYKWEKNIAYPNIDTLKAISKYFNVTIDYLLDNEPPNKISLTAERAKLVSDFEDLTPDGQQLIWATLRVLLSANGSARAAL